MADAVLVLGEDVTNTAPLLALALRQAVRQQPLRQADEAAAFPLWMDAAVREAVQQDARARSSSPRPRPRRLDDIAARTFRARAGRPRAAGLRRGRTRSTPRRRRCPGLPARRQRSGRQHRRGAARRGAAAGRRRHRACGSEAVMRAAADVAWALCAAGQAAPTLPSPCPECNSLGLALMGGRPLGEALEPSRTAGRHASSCWRTTSTAARRPPRGRRAACAARAT